MATEAPVNGNYAPHQGYGGLEQHSYAYPANASTPSQSAAAQPPPPASTTPAANSAAAPQSEVPKDEVGWYFVEQYYTTLSRSPEKLYLFYNKRSQFVSGQETDKVSVCVGQKAINDRIKELAFNDCKVRVTNVDSQASDSNIVIQVIGEISNKSQPHKKFTQTFVLATQPTGYFVLNDIFRYLVDEEEEPEQTAEAGEEEIHAPMADSGYQEPAPTAAEVEPKELTGSADPATVEHDAAQVDREIENKIPTEQRADTTEPKVNGVAASEPETKEEEPPALPETVEEPAAAEPAAPVVEEKPEPEKQAPEPAPTPSAPAQAPSQPAAPPKPAAPKTWASLAASANRVATPATPSTASSASSQPKAAPKPAQSTAATASAPTPAAAPAATPSAPAAQRDASPADNSQGEEWTAVPSSHNRNQSRQANAQPETPMWRGYISKVHQGVDGNALRDRLATFGEVLYFDIAQQKNCAFVDFKTAEGYNAAIAANPHNISGEDLYLEERKFRPGATPYVPRGQYQGRGRGGPQGAPRGNYQGGRGGSGYNPRGGRGGNGAPRGRGSSIAA